MVVLRGSMWFNPTASMTGVTSPTMTPNGTETDDCCPSSSRQGPRRRQWGGRGRWLVLLMALLVLGYAVARPDDDWYSGEDEEEEEDKDRKVVVPRAQRLSEGFSGKQFIPPRPEDFDYGAQHSDAYGQGGKRKGGHKGFFPLDSTDLWGLLFTSLGLMVAAGGGIGGGGILVPIFILIMGFSPKYAIPLSNVTILGGSIMNMVMNVKKRHPNADRPLVDWDLILIMEPLTIGGALAGGFVNKVLPEWLLVISLVLLLGYTAQTTLEKGLTVYKKETEAMKAQAKAKSLQLRELHNKELSGEAAAESDLLLEPGQYEHPEENTAKAELQALLEKERHTPREKVGLLVVCFIVVLALNITKGGGSFRSPLAIECGSFAFWFVTFLVFAWVIGISLYVRKQLITMWYYKAKVGYKYVKGDIEWNEWSTIKYPCICFFAGFFAGMFGIGGGIVKGPLMLEMGVDPMVASASSACMILFTSFTATTTFMIFDMLIYDYAFWLFIIGFVFTSIGQFGLLYLMKKYNRNSYIIFSIGGVVGLSAVLMGLQSLISFWQGHGGGGGSICDGAV